MTGFAAASREISEGSLHIEIRSVNSRFLEIQFRMPEELRLAEPLLREAITAKVSRGKVECRVNFTASASRATQSGINQGLLDSLLTLNRTVLAQSPHTPALTAGEILKWPGILAENDFSAEQARDEAVVLMQGVLVEFVAARRREGEKLSVVLLERVTEMKKRVATVEPMVPLAVAAYQEKIAQRLRDAIGSADDERVRQEIALFSVKVDVAEEIARLGGHLTEIEHILQRGGAAGKRLDFMMQELNREANTLGSKSVSTEVSDCAMELKLLIEQMREQVQNIE